MMESLLSLLMFVGLFLLMMRFGCGAHATRGHGQGNGGPVEDLHEDPVCGNRVDPQQGYGKVLDGKLHRFCSRECLDRFDAEPARFLPPPAAKAGEHGH